MWQRVSIDSKILLLPFTFKLIITLIYSKKIKQVVVRTASRILPKRAKATKTCLIKSVSFVVDISFCFSYLLDNHCGSNLLLLPLIFSLGDYRVVLSFVCFLSPSPNVLISLNRHV